MQLKSLKFAIMCIWDYFPLFRSFLLVFTTFYIQFHFQLFCFWKGNSLNISHVSVLLYFSFLTFRYSTSRLSGLSHYKSEGHHKSKLCIPNYEGKIPIFLINWWFFFNLLIILSSCFLTSLPDLHCRKFLLQTQYSDFRFCDHEE